MPGALWSYWRRLLWHNQWLRDVQLKISFPGSEKDQLRGCLHNLTVSKRARLSRIAAGCFSNSRAQVNRAVLRHTHVRLRHLRRHTISCIPESLSVSKLLQGRSEEDVNETTPLYEQKRANTEYFKQRNCHKMQQSIQSCTNQGVRCFSHQEWGSGYYVWSVTAPDWVWGSVTSQQDGCSLVSNLGLAVRSLAPDARQLMHCVKHQRRAWTPILTPAVFIKPSPTFFSFRWRCPNPTILLTNGLFFSSLTCLFCVVRQL